MGGLLSRSERYLLEATERHIATVKQLISKIRNIHFANIHHTIEHQATNGRRQEITTATTLRRILSIVIVASMLK